jgi:hypothetical protein
MHMDLEEGEQTPQSLYPPALKNYNPNKFTKATTYSGNRYPKTEKTWDRLMNNYEHCFKTDEQFFLLNNTIKQKEGDLKRQQEGI